MANRVVKESQMAYEKVFQMATQEPIRCQGRNEGLRKMKGQSAYMI